MCFSQCKCSVITVHGIRDDPKVAWTDENGTWWVNNDLFGDLSTRQVDYLYQIDATSTIFEPDGVVQHAQKLITQYARLRQELEEVKPQHGHRVALQYRALVCTLLTDTPPLADRNRPAHHLDMP